MAWYSESCWGRSRTVRPHAFLGPAAGFLTRLWNFYCVVCNSNPKGGMSAHAPLCQLDSTSRARAHGKLKLWFRWTRHTTSSLKTNPPCTNCSCRSPPGVCNANPRYERKSGSPSLGATRFSWSRTSSLESPSRVASSRAKPSQVMPGRCSGVN